ncbi:MAG: hypothetical protein GXZ11_03065 [Tissierellia bacterium]|nr:hypothetical protein [Tissierellia bacterium]
MTKETLKNYTDLKYEIYRIEKRLEKLKNTVEHDSVTGSNPEFPYQPIQIHIQGYATSRIQRLEKILLQRKEQAEGQRLEIEEFIASIEDSRTRIIFEMRYIENKSWMSISRKFGSCDESYARKRHDRYLEYYR